MALLETVGGSEELIDVAGTRICVRRRGRQNGLPAIVLEAGAGATSAAWGWIQKRLSEQTLVLSYDRAGLGASDIAPSDVSANAAASRLDALLRALRLPPPYILVGHSLGGLLAQYYAAHHADEVAALVLIDPTPSDSSLFPKGHDRFAPVYHALFHIVQGLARIGALRIWNPLARLAARSGLPPRETQHIIDALGSPRHLQTVLRELKEIAAVQACANASPIPPDIPQMVVTAGVRKPQPDESGTREARFYAAVLKSHQSAAARSAFGRHVTISGADHNTLLTRREFADQVADLIIRFAEECKSTAARADPCGAHD